LHNAFVLHPANFMLPIDVNLVRSCLASNYHIPFDALAGNRLKDYLDQLFVGLSGFVLLSHSRYTSTEYVKVVIESPYGPASFT
jgi:nucleoid-associated protein YejK